MALAFGSSPIRIGNRCRERSEMPLTEVTGRVTGLFQQFGQRDLLILNVPGMC